MPQFVPFYGGLATTGQHGGSLCGNKFVPFEQVAVNVVDIVCTVIVVGACH